MSKHPREAPKRELPKQKAGGFSKHTHSLVVTKTIPKFLQAYGVKPEPARQAEEVLRASRIRPTHDDELPTIANLDEFLQDGAGGLDKDKLRALIRSEEEGDEDRPATVESSATETGAGEVELGAEEQQFGRHRRVEDPEADAMEAVSGRHVFRPRASGQKRKAAASLGPAAAVTAGLEEPDAAAAAEAAPEKKADTLDAVIARYLEGMGEAPPAEAPAAAEQPPKKKPKPAAAKKKPIRKPTGGLSFSLDDD